MSVRKNNQGRFYFSVRYIDTNGKTHQKKVESTIWKSKKEAKAAEELFLQSFKGPDNKMKYRILYENYISNKSMRVKSRSLLSYTDIHERHILPEFGNKQISKITKEQIRSWQRQLLNKGYSNAYMKNIQSVFKRVLNWGVSNDLIEKNPFSIDYAKRIENKKEMDFFTLEEFQQFSSVIDDETDYLVFNFLYWTGVRKGELQALSISDIDTDKKIATISKNYDYRNHKISTPKTASSYREIMIPDHLNTLLIKHIENTKRLPGYSDKLFLFGIDKPISSTTLERKKNRYCKEAGVKRIRIHDFRHSHVSLLINSEINDFDIAKRLGHSRDLVNNTYGHWFKKNQEKLVSKLNDILTTSENSRILN